MGLMIGTAIAQSLSWSKPTTLANGSAIPADTITGYKVYKDTGSGFSLSNTITDEDTLSASVSGNTGDRFAVATTYANGQSPLSWPVEVTNFPDPDDASVTVVGDTANGDDDDFANLATVMNAASPGDTIYIRGGTYTHAVTGSFYWHTITNSGTEGNPITLASYPGEWAILAGRAATNPLPNRGANVSGITKGNPTTFTTSTDHNLVDASTIKFDGTYVPIVDDGPGGDIETTFNGSSYVVTVTGASTFTVPVDSSSFTNNYSSGGLVFEPLAKPDPDGNERLISLQGDWWIIRDLEFKDSQRICLEVTGSNVTVDYSYLHNAWDSPIFMGSSGQVCSNVTIKNCEVHNGLHHTNIRIYPGSDFTDSMRVENCISYHAGYLESDGVKAWPINGDPAGGGNSDVLGGAKDAFDNQVTTNLLPNMVWRNVIGWKGADDNYDSSAADGVKYVRVFGFDSGPQGKRNFKTLRAVHEDYSHLQCWFGDSQHHSGSIGLELRGSASASTTTINCGMVHQDGAGYSSSVNASATEVTKNNLSWNNTDNDSLSNVDTDQTNFWNNGTTPQVEDATFSRPTNLTLPGSPTPVRDNIHARYDHIYKQIQQNWMPTASGNLVNAGTYDAAIHAATASDDPTTPADPEQDLVLWTKATSSTDSSGSVPDIGAISYVYINPPTNVSIS